MPVCEYCQSDDGDVRQREYAALQVIDAATPTPTPPELLQLEASARAMDVTAEYAQENLKPSSGWNRGSEMRFSDRANWSWVLRGIEFLQRGPLTDPI